MNIDSAQLGTRPLDNKPLEDKPVRFAIVRFQMVDMLRHHAGNSLYPTVRVVLAARRRINTRIRMHTHTYGHIDIQTYRHTDIQAARHLSDVMALLPQQTKQTCTHERAPPQMAVFVIIGSAHAHEMPHEGTGVTSK